VLVPTKGILTNIPLKGTRPQVGRYAGRQQASHSTGRSAKKENSSVKNLPSPTVEDSRAYSFKDLHDYQEVSQHWEPVY
jgi:hypothetical protein